MHFAIEETTMRNVIMRYIFLMLLAGMLTLSGCGDSGGDSGGSSNSEAEVVDTPSNGDDDDTGNDDGSSDPENPSDGTDPDDTLNGYEPPKGYEPPANTQVERQDFSDPNFYSQDSYNDESQDDYYDDRVKPEPLNRDERIEKLALLQNGVWVMHCKPFSDDFNFAVELTFSDYAMPDNINFEVTDFLMLRATINTYDSRDAACSGTPLDVRDVSGAYRVSNLVTANNGDEALDMTIRLFETIDITATQGSQVYYLIAKWNDWQMQMSNWLVDDTNHPAERGTELNYIHTYLNITH